MAAHWPGWGLDVCMLLVNFATNLYVPIMAEVARRRGARLAVQTTAYLGGY